MPANRSRAVTFQGRRYAALLFDMDGTMLDSSAVVERVWMGWAKKYNVDTVELLHSIRGVRAEDTIRRFAPADVDVAEEVDYILSAEIADVVGIVPVAGIEALIARLDRREWAVVTSAQRALAEVRLLAANLPIPDVFITAEDVLHGKPDPEGYLKAADGLGVSIKDCLIFEDSRAGVMAAKAAGASVAVVGSVAPVEEGMLRLNDFL
jgi:sugar-phosphatase